MTAISTRSLSRGSNKGTVNTICICSRCKKLSVRILAGFLLGKYVLIIPRDTRRMKDSTSSRHIHIPLGYHYFLKQWKNGYSMQFILHKQTAPLGATTCKKVSDSTIFSLALLIQSPMIID